VFALQFDIFEDEQRIYDEALAKIRDVEAGADFCFEEYIKLAENFGNILRQFRCSIRISDKTTVGLYEDNIDLSDKAHHDSLTGIFNRRYAEENMERVIKSLSRSNGELSVMMLDIDFFKKYNDTYGHIKGDICLKTVAETLNESLLRPDDFVVRYGGEEFIVVLPNTNRDGAQHMAEKMLMKLKGLKIPHKNSEVAEYLTASVGIVTCFVENTHDFEYFVKRADEALYISKNNGRNRYTCLS